MTAPPYDARQEYSLATTSIASDQAVPPLAGAGLRQRPWRDRVPRASTLAERRAMVERVVLELRRRFAEPITLEDMARIAICSPFHFNRIFRQVTGLPPCRFLAALRLAAAKRLLVTTRLSVTEICYGVGCGSLGTFTTCFSSHVGLTPSAFRRAATPATAAMLVAAMHDATNAAPAPSAPHGAGTGAAISGHVVPADGAPGPVVVGLFREAVPRGQPVTCALARAGGSFVLGGVPDGRYHVFALGVGGACEQGGIFLQEYAPRGHTGPVRLRAGVPQREDVVLRVPRLTDPPILLAVPMLLAERVAGARAV